MIMSGMVLNPEYYQDLWDIGKEYEAIGQIEEFWKALHGPYDKLENVKQRLAQLREVDFTIEIELLDCGDDEDTHKIMTWMTDTKTYKRAKIILLRDGVGKDSRHGWAYRVVDIQPTRRDK